MKGIVLFAGTTEGRKLSECLAGAGIRHTVCVATAYGEIVLKKHPLVTVCQGRMDQEEILAFMQKGDFKVVVDATHPYAEQVTRHIKGAVETLHGETESQLRQVDEIIYLRLRREKDAASEKKAGIESGRIVYFNTSQACADALKHTEGNILLTTGSKELSAYCACEALKHRLYVRVLPAVESLALCEKQGIAGKQIIAMQGPFTIEMNEAIIRQYRIAYLVTKESGVSGGYPEKLEAAEKTETKVFVIGRPKEEEGDSFVEICRKLEGICGRKIPAQKRMEIILAGVGMGQRESMTKEAERAVSEADILLGAERLLAGFSTTLEKHAYYTAEQIIPYLRKVQEENPFFEKRKVVVLFSGDSGFYSGCQALYTALCEEIKENRLAGVVRILPGISSVAYLAACAGESYQDAVVYSMHGKSLCNLAHRIRDHAKTFLLTSGVKDVNRLGKELVEAGLTACEIIAGFQLSYEEQRIESYTPEECCALSEEGLYTCLVKNPLAGKVRLTPGIPDAAFIRGQVPMTKEEVRTVSLAKLHLQEDSVVYDIGSGTGSVAVEIASLSNEIQVYAVERKPEAVSLIRANREKFLLDNITVIEAEAPEGLTGLPAATHAFVGGSGGKLQAILEVLRQSNPRMWVVINAVTMETICEIKEILEDSRMSDVEVVQMQVSKAKAAGAYHLIKAENPVWVCAFTFGQV